MKLVKMELLRSSQINANDLDVIGKEFFHSSREIDIESNLEGDGSSKVDMSDDIVARNDGYERKVPANKLKVHGQDIRCNHQSDYDKNVRRKSSQINANDLDIIGKEFFQSCREIDIEMN